MRRALPKEVMPAPPSCTLSPPPEIDRLPSDAEVLIPSVLRALKDALVPLQGEDTPAADSDDPVEEHPSGPSAEDARTEERAATRRFHSSPTQLEVSRVAPVYTPEDQGAGADAGIREAVTLAAKFPVCLLARPPGPSSLGPINTVEQCSWSRLLSGRDVFLS